MIQIKLQKLFQELLDIDIDPYVVLVFFVPFSSPSVFVEV